MGSSTDLCNLFLLDLSLASYKLVQYIDVDAASKMAEIVFDYR